VLLTAVATSTAEAHMIHQGKKETESHYAARVVWHGRTAIKWLTQNKRYIVFSAGPRALVKELKAHRWLLNYGLKIQHRLYLQSLPPNYGSWLCIHGYEGSWTDSGDPYWGGLQMDRGFMETYAPLYKYKFHVNLLSKGWANAWSPIEQIWVAELAHEHGKSWHSGWPNTSRECGL
jgi:hypothetical protein